MDEESKFLITTKVSTKARVRDSRSFFADAREQTQKQPAFLITDGRHPLTDSIHRELPDAQHVRLVSIRDKRTNNNNIERLNGTCRDRFKTCRGFQSEETAEIMTSAFRNYYNFIRLHSSIGTTPAIKAGIGIEMHGNRWNRLLELSFKADNKNN